MTTVQPGSERARGWDVGDGEGLPRGWWWKHDPNWNGVVCCATDGHVEVWLSTDGELSIYGCDSAPADVVIAVLGSRIVDKLRTVLHA